MTLAEYIKKEGVTLRDFAQKINVGYYTLQRYLNGKRYPKPEVFKAIYKATGGKVAPNDFYELK